MFGSVPNCRLIAAAPDLLEALHTIMRQPGFEPDEPYGVQAPCSHRQGEARHGKRNPKTTITPISATSLDGHPPCWCGCYSFREQEGFEMSRKKQTSSRSSRSGRMNRPAGIAHPRHRTCRSQPGR